MGKNSKEVKKSADNGGEEPCVRFYGKGCCKTNMFSTALKGRHEKHNYSDLSWQPLTGKALVSKNSNKHINGSPLSAAILGQGCAMRACDCGVVRMYLNIRVTAKKR